MYITYIYHVHETTNKNSIKNFEKQSYHMTLVYIYYLGSND